MRKLFIPIGLALFTSFQGLGGLPLLAATSIIASEGSSQSVSVSFSDAIQTYQEGNYQDAIAQWNVLLLKAEVQENPILLGQAWNYLALAQLKLNQGEAAQEAIQKSLTYLTPSETQPISTVQQQSLAQAFNTLGQIQLEQGQHEKATASWEKSEAIYRKLNDKTGLQGSLMNQALALEQGGFLRRACFTILEAVDVERQCNFVDGESAEPFIAAFSRQADPRFQAIALHNFSKIVLKLGNLSLAETLIKQNKALSQQHPMILNRIQITEAFIAYSRYQAYRQEASRARTRRIAKALQHNVITQAQKTENLYRQIVSQGGANPHHYPVQVDYLAFLIDYQFWLQDNQLDYGEVETQMRSQISHLNRLSPSTAWNQAAQFSQIKHAESLIRLLEKDKTQYSDVTTTITNLLQPLIIETGKSATQTPAFAYGALGRFYEIQQQWSLAQQSTESAISVLHSSPNTDISYRWQWQLGRILAAQGERDRAIEAYEQALIALQSIRKDLGSLNRNAQLSFRDQIEPSYREFVALLLDGDTPNTQALAQARGVIDRLQVSEVEDFLLQNCITASLASIDAYIEEQATNSALIYTIVQNDHVDVIVKMPGSDDIQFHRVNQSQVQFDQFLKDFRRSLQTKLPSARRTSQRQGKQLYDWLIAPFETQFQEQNIDTLVFVLDGALRDIPMATLFTGEEYLIKKYAIAVTPGLQVLEAGHQAGTVPEAIVAGASEGDRTLGLPALPAVRREIQQIQSTLPDTKVLLDDAFSTNTLQSSLEASTASIIHIATHGQFSSNPEETFIVTGNGERLDIDELGNLLRQRTRSQSLELLFLSACQTLAGDRWAALGMAGVAIRSGAQSTIASIWSADDEASAELVTRFYQKLSDGSGRSKAEALRLAQIEMLDNPRFTLPVYWSPYVLIGNWQ